MKLTRSIPAVLAAFVALSATPGIASAFTADDSYDTRASSGARLYGSVDYLGSRSVEVIAGATDAPGDAFCTVVEAELWANDQAGYRKLGNTVTLGSVCNGRTATFALKPISTAAGDIFEVRLQSRRGAGGPWATNMGLCRRLTDSTWDNCR